jgi:FMN reductase
MTTSKPVTIVGLGGSLAPTSSNLIALTIALKAARDDGAETELLDLGQLDLPMYRPGLSPVPPSVQHLCDSVYRADGLLWASPLYHGTISGAFKNALDWLQLLSDREPAYLTDKVIGLISTAGGTQGLQAVNTMEYVVRALRGWAVPLVIPIARAWDEFDTEGHARHPEVEKQLQALGREVTRAAGIFAAQQLTSREAAAAEAALQPIDDNK